jgi:hypothetical protein
MTFSRPSRYKKSVHFYHVFASVMHFIPTHPANFSISRMFLGIEPAIVIVMWSENEPSRLDFLSFFLSFFIIFLELFFVQKV